MKPRNGEGATDAGASSDPQIRKPDQLLNPPTASPTRKQDRRATLSEPVEIAKFWKNRKGDAVIVRLSTYEGHNIADVRTWFTAGDGKMRPGKGFTCGVRHLEKLVDALARARLKAKELGLIDVSGDGE
jgi:hypothetical protein